MRNDIIIRKIIGYAEKIAVYCESINDKKVFTDNSIIVEACVFNLSQIGELANRLDDSFTNNYPVIPWRAIYGLRNRIVHDYDGVNLNLVWEIIRDDLPDLIIRLRSILQTGEQPT